MTALLLFFALPALGQSIAGPSATSSTDQNTIDTLTQQVQALQSGNPTVTGNPNFSQGFQVNGVQFTVGVATTVIASSTSSLPSGNNGITYAGNILAYDVMVSSFDATGAGVDVGTVTIPVSTGTYVLECMACQITTASQMVIQINGDSGTNYRGGQMWQEDDASVTGDTGAGLSFCYASRSGSSVAVGWPYVFRMEFTTIGNSRLKGYADYDFTLSAGTPFDYHGHTGCQYNGSATVTQIALKASTASGKWAGHLELRRIH